MNKTIANKDVINFFSTSSYGAIMLFILFAIFILIMSFLTMYVRTSTKNLREVAKEINDSTKAQQKVMTENKERDKKYSEAFLVMREKLQDSEQALNDLRLEVKEMHTYCMAKNQQDRGENKYEQN